MDKRFGFERFYRWWWNGNRVRADEILRELKLLKASGADGPVLDHLTGLRLKNT